MFELPEYMHLLAPADDVTPGFALSLLAKIIFPVSALYDLNCVGVP
jgi:hypothetical protein